MGLPVVESSAVVCRHLFKCSGSDIPMFVDVSH